MPYVHEHGGRRPPALHGRQVGEGFDGRARLAQGEGDVHLAIDLGIVKANAPQHGQDVAGRWVHGDQSGVRGIALAQPGDFVSGDLLSQSLHLQVEGRVDAQTAPIQQLCPIEPLQLLAYIHDHMGRSHHHSERNQAQRLDRSLPELSLGDVPSLVHQSQHSSAPSQGALCLCVGIVAGRRLDQADQQSRFRQAEFRRGFAKVGLRCRPNAVGKIPQVYLVEIDLQYLVLAILTTDLGRQDRLLQLPR